ncbi:hypothetical protein K458DRAFT_415126 [Lentithecium fluviatile CBS 122367]|uniref:Uncharacterized protein n=1 Tax=Lentithecium fluviatile CBS 122367 TaxID=1168545 RepID=A0A6G1JD17_9PLEO|nr:hypothetical protein K458DRAFT_415126 [Lentithecium fluviatile CBS 122367]
MDYQTFSSPQHLPPAFGGGFSSSAAPTHTHSPQQQLYADPQARLQQSNPSFSYAQAPFTNGQPGAGGFASSLPGAQSASGAMMQLGGLSQSQLHQARAHALQQQQQHHQQQSQPSPSPYSSAPFAQALASPALAQFPQARSPSTASTTASAPAYATPTAQHSQSMNPPHSTPATSTPMAQTPVKAVPRSPVSPVAQAREKQRIDTLLEINQALIQEVMELHTQGKAGHIGPAPDKPEGEKQQQPSMEYRDCMRRLQANLAFLAQNAEKHTKPNQAILPGPAIMNPPSSPEKLVTLYKQLSTLFPGWTGAQAKSSPGPQRLNSTSSQASMQNHMQPPNSAGLHNNMQPPNSAGLPPNMQLPSNANAMNHMQNNIQPQ